MNAISGVVMVMGSLAVQVGQPPAPHRAEKIETAAFESLAIEMKGHRGPGRRKIAIQGDGKYTFDLEDYHADYRLKPEHVRRLEELLKATDWLTLSTGRDVLIPDATIYTLTLDRKGHETTVNSNDIRPGPYTNLIRFIRRIERQETLLRQATTPGQQNSAAHELKSELDSLSGKPIGMPYAPVLDYHRLVPVCTEWLARPQGRSDDAIAAAAELVAFLKIESQRPNLEAIAGGRLPGDPKYESSDGARIAAVNALARLGSGKSLSVLQSLHAHDSPFVRQAVAEALLGASPDKAIPILKQMSADTRPAAWALIRLGDKAESAIIEILREPTLRSSGPGHVIREYYEHWKELPTPPSNAIVAAIHDRVQAEAGLTAPDRYGLEVLKLAGAPLVARNAWQDLEATLSLMASKGQQQRKTLLLSSRFPSHRTPEEFLKDAESGNLRIRRVMADRTSALAHVVDQKGDVNYVLRLNRVGVVWSIWVVWAVPSDEVPDRLNDFLKSYPQAKEVRADDPVPKTEA
jgi:HEAT repeat protein